MAWTVWIPLVVAIFAAAMAFLSGTFIERSKRKHALQTEAYADYLSAVARSSSATSAERQSILADAALAKCKIVIHGADEVIVALKGFELSGADTSCEQGRDRLFTLVLAMRGDSKVSRSDISGLLLGDFQQRPKA